MDKNDEVPYREFLAWVCDCGPVPKEIKATFMARVQPLLFPAQLGRGTGFNDIQRKQLGLEGLTPPVIETLDKRVRRWKATLDEEPEALKKYSLLSQLHSVDTHAFYRLLHLHITEFLPVVYTPTVGAACVKWSRLYRNDQGMYISYFEHKGRIRQLLDNWVMPVDIIVVTDGGRILGLGDLGVNGMGIPVGKIALYVAGAGFHPMRSLPVTLDCGTDTKSIIDDELYIGAKQPRISASEHAAFLEEFSMAVKDRWPNCLIQYEDFATERAFAVLEAMQKRCLCFNDDIQGTGSVVLSGFINGMKAQGTPLREARVVFYGAGSSAVGVALQIAQLLESEGLSRTEARNQVWMIDTKGLITTTRGDRLPPHKQHFARADGTKDMKSLVEVISTVKPNALFGLTGAGPAFTREVVEALCDGQKRPLIFPLSNPTSKAEVAAADAYAWSKGRCIFAAGSPFEPVHFEGETFVPGQANNVLVFPGIGFGAWAVSAKECADEFYIEAAKELASCVSDEDVARGTIYPSVSQLRELSVKVAARVAACAFDLGLAKLQVRPPNLEAYIRELMYEPTYGA
eukprot:TRINITY_DN2263_c0_g1_i1.p1 TRINITY_DN2263_c0_g1~~TRINITY_DN2263_c0_g1_i1.p1  ORF type:complete len:650 (-),score=88.33 TRINITY_DN2263_c0_g1_i1:1529-3244(-)